MRLSSCLAARLLDFGLPLTILVGLLAGTLLFPQFSLWEAGILAAILAPTDLGLGALVVSSPRVPERIREASGSMLTRWLSWLPMRRNISL